MRPPQHSRRNSDADVLSDIHKSDLPLRITFIRLEPEPDSVTFRIAEVNEIFLSKIAFVLSF
jgi:hypothetical protein